jgi:tetratricopeptide (TPR) repeat protein
LDELYLLSDKHSVAYYRVEAILTYVEFDYEEEVKNLEENIQQRAEELKNYEEKYNFPHLFGRMKIYQAHLLFDHQQYNEAMALYEQAIVQLSEHGGYSKYSLDSELARLAQKIKMLDDKEKIIKLFTFLKISWAKEKIDGSIVEKLLKWSESQIELTEYGM